MAFHFHKAYPPDIEELLRQYYRSLSEKDRRRFAALEAMKLGHGGTEYIAHVLGCDAKTIREGMGELKQLPDDPAGPRVRKPGGGRKKTETQHPDLITHVQRSIANRTAGDPMRHDLVWTDLTPREIANTLHDQDLSVGPALSDAFSIPWALPGAKSPRCYRAVRRWIATPSFVIWPISSKTFKKRATPF